MTPLLSVADPGLVPAIITPERDEWPGVSARNENSAYI